MRRYEVRDGNAPERRSSIRFAELDDAQQCLRWIDPRFFIYDTVNEECVS